MPVMGWVYCLSNPSFPHLVKVGFTTRTVEERLNELNSSTSIPTPFKLEFKFNSANPMEDEATAHKCLDEHRQSDRREFFALSASEAFDMLSKVLPNAKVIYQRFMPKALINEFSASPKERLNELAHARCHDVNRMNALRSKM